MRIVNSPGLMTSFTSLDLTILLRGWRQQKQPFRPHFAFVQMMVKRISRGRGIFIMATSITTAHWLNWKLPAKLCRMILGYSRRWVSSRGVRDTGKNLHEASSEHLSSTRATLTRSTRSDLVTEASGVMLNKNRSSIAYWLSSQTISGQKQSEHSWT